jgi:tetratricopeptide (TPR) repeat protein
MRTEMRNPRSRRSPKHECRTGRSPIAGVGMRTFASALLLLAASTFAATDGTASVKVEPQPESARDFFNAGTRMLRAGKLGEAEAYLQKAVSMQNESLQPAGLYNLGHTRFAQGAEELKKAEDGGKAASRARRAAAQANAISRAADGAMASNDAKRMVDLYMQGRGIRRELREATKAVRQAMETHASVLLKWQRAGDDFRSAAELHPADIRPRENAEIVNRHIAQLIDKIREMQQALAAAAQAQQQLGEKMKEMRGRIPDSDAPPGDNGEDEEEEDGLNGMRPEMREAPGRTGEEQQMTPEEAGQMLDGLRREGERRLPMGQSGEGVPSDPNKPTW